MSLTEYFTSLIERVQSTDSIHNGGKDENGFYKPTRQVVLTSLNLLKDLHDKPTAKPMVKNAWQTVVKELPSEWLILSPENKQKLKKILE
jgi:hypothetical protein